MAGFHGAYLLWIGGPPFHETNIMVLGAPLGSPGFQQLPRTEHIRTSPSF